ncbi:hypothetical protein IVB34_47890 [Bradyrhizobium sp. 2]|uniref:hypothetical protein n=1 Tax=Bradyrhizobium sp. 2 TaxID=190045 RepID=UPI001FFA3F0F|nr:hypothetical protein [Bradyrhizobium sp. 2]MCK1465810.1 hypothetical protein [Bradyrhizobium sp. 2]
MAISVETQRKLFFEFEVLADFINPLDPFGGGQRPEQLPVPEKFVAELLAGHVRPHARGKAAEAEADAAEQHFDAVLGHAAFSLVLRRRIACTTSSEAP